MSEEGWARFRSALDEFPQPAREILGELPTRRGRLDSAECLKLMRIMSLDVGGLMVRLLPLAQAYALAPISGFRVGAVAQACAPASPEKIELYLGANMEFLGVALNFTVHAEQSAAMNAWHQGAKRLLAIAVTDSPCGYCRQFMNEWGGEDAIRVITAATTSRPHDQRLLPGLLPMPFGPADLGRLEGLAAGGSAAEPLRLDEASDLAARALEAAQGSYAPYSGNLAGCAARLRDGNIHTGTYVESAAFNPSLSPLQSLAINLNLAGVPLVGSIESIALVEAPAGISQLGGARVLLEAWAPWVKLEYHQTMQPRHGG